MAEVVDTNSTNNSTTDIVVTSDLGYGGILLKFGTAERAAFFSYFLQYGILFIVTSVISWFILWKKLPTNHICLRV